MTSAERQMTNANRPSGRFLLPGARGGRIHDVNPAAPFHYFFTKTIRVKKFHRLFTDDCDEVR